jgi:hypothetical protein
MTKANLSSEFKPRRLLIGRRMESSESLLAS